MASGSPRHYAGIDENQRKEASRLTLSYVFYPPDMSAERIQDVGAHRCPCPATNAD